MQQLFFMRGRTSFFQSYRLYLATVCLLAFFSTTVNAQDDDASSGGTATTVTGTITGEDSESALAGVNIVIKGKMEGTTTNADGTFSLQTNEPRPFTVIIPIVGYEKQEVEITEDNKAINLALPVNTILGDEVVISASRYEESILTSPVSIEKMDLATIKESAAPSYYDALLNVKSVDLVTSSLAYKSVNTRGFNNPGNTRFVQMVDGVDMMAPSLNFSLGNIIGPTDLDVQSVELIPGAASALYGNAALNGAMNITTKSLFLHQGLSAQAKLGVNHTDGEATDPSIYHNYSLRYAKAFNDRFAFKVNLGYMRGTDWHANSTGSRLGNLNDSRLLNPGFDGVNTYGDEISVGSVTDETGRSVSITRTGYDEKSLTDYKVENFKADASLHYKIKPNLEASYGYRIGGGQTVYTGFQRYNFKNFTQQQHRLELKGADFFVRGSMSAENTGDTYDMGLTAQGINTAWKDDKTWFSEYQSAYNRSANLFNGIQRHQYARNIADQGRLLPGSAAFDNALNQISGANILETNLPNGAKGSKFTVSSKLYNAEGMYNLSKLTKDVVDIQIGGNYRFYDLDSKGTLFPDTTGNDMTMYEYGAYLQAGKRLLQEKLKLQASVRYDKSEQIDEGKFTPRVSAVYTLKNNHNFRASFQTGFRMPSTQEQFIDLDLGYIHLLGGLPEIARRYGGLSGDNVFTASSVRSFAARQNGTLNRANQSLNELQYHSNTGKIKPEGVTTYELGYKTLLADKKLMIDIAGFHSTYSNFIAAKQVVVTPSKINTDPMGVAADLSSGNYKVFAVYTNAQEDVTSWGYSLGATYRLNTGFILNGNFAHATLNLKQDDLIAAFNTPENKFNVSFGHPALYKKVGFNIAWRWTDGFQWKSTFSEGFVSSMNTFDAQLSYKLTSLKSMVRVGAANLLNSSYNQLYGGPNVGGLYYISITFDELMN